MGHPQHGAGVDLLAQPSSLLQQFRDNPEDGCQTQKDLLSPSKLCMLPVIYQDGFDNTVAPDLQIAVTPGLALPLSKMAVIA
jgi:hypothetical protein